MGLLFWLPWHPGGLGVDQMWFILELECRAADLTSGRCSKYLWREAMLYRSAFLSLIVLERYYWSTKEADKLSDQFRADHPPSHNLRH